MTVAQERGSGSLREQIAEIIEVVALQASSGTPSPWLMSDRDPRCNVAANLILITILAILEKDAKGPDRKPDVVEVERVPLTDSEGWRFTDEEDAAIREGAIAIDFVVKYWRDRGMPLAAENAAKDAKVLRGMLEDVYGDDIPANYGGGT